MDNKLLVGLIVIILVLAVVGVYFFGGEKDINDEEEFSVEEVIEEDVAADNSEGLEFEELSYKGVDGENHVVSIEEYSFTPKEIVIKKGDTVTWVNNGERKHYIFSLGLPKRIKSLNLFLGDEYSVTFDEVGEFRYLDIIFKGMQGKVIVEL